MINHRNYYLYSENGGFKPKTVQNPEDIEFLIVDLFCGAGGTTTGFDMARIKNSICALVIACVNHDPIAIKSHWANHPEIAHFEEDIRTLELGPLLAVIESYRILYPTAKIVLWASLECTNFSKAKGGQPRDADSRTLAEHLYRYIKAIDPDYIQIENVVEFMSWGPLDKNGKPVSRKNGSDWLKWRNEINSFGYRDEWKELNSADFGAYTSRNRLFGCFAKHGLTIVWPEPTHSKSPQKADLFGSGLKKWKAVKDVLDFEDEGKSIFGRNKPLSDKTLERIYAGLIKYVAGGKEAFLVKWNSMSAKGKYEAPSIESPCPVVTTQNRLGACFITKYYSGRPEGKVIPVTGPAGTITTVGGQTLVQPVFLAKYYGNGDNISSVEEPAGTLTTKDRITKVQTVWLDNTFSGNRNHQSIEQPAGTILSNDHHQKVTVKHYYLVNPSHGGHSMSIENPCPVIIARQDKAPLYLHTIINSEKTDVSLENFLQEDDCRFIQALENDDENPPSEMSIRFKIIHFMQLYGIGDIKMRMLKVSELKVIQGFPKNYILDGNQTDQKKFIGNSVVPHVVKSWCEAMANKNRILREVA